MKISFIHTADLHLGLRLTRFKKNCADKIRGARIQALERILVEAKGHAVDFIIIAGDLFDDISIDSTTSRRTFYILESSTVPVFILPGNHDPAIPGSVWEREPWCQEQKERVRVLSSRQPLEVKAGVMLFPCPVFRKTSLEDPTLWIPPRSTSEDDNVIRIGVAHGSIRDRENLPDDDHLIDRNAAENKGLDYLALGHWHKMGFYNDSDGTCRTTYPGVHEPMCFRGVDNPYTGWVPYASGANREVFFDEGPGEVLLVTIDGPRVEPQIERLNVGHLKWKSEVYTILSEKEVGQLISEIATRPTPERSLIRLRLEGVLNAKAMLRLDELKDVLEERYLHHEIDMSRLHLMPEEEEIREVAGRGVLRGVLEDLITEAKTTATVQPEEILSRQSVAERAIMLLYQIAKKEE
ncbi:MAG: DNA repair exonuclease [Dehalococcoidales bacterium]|nr:DNA repair exonuclease [Dehalococcoidales bacterium]